MIRYIFIYFLFLYFYIFIYIIYTRTVILSYRSLARIPAHCRRHSSASVTRRSEVVQQYFRLAIESTSSRRLPAFFWRVRSPVGATKQNKELWLRSLQIFKYDSTIVRQYVYMIYIYIYKYKSIKKPQIPPKLQKIQNMNYGTYIIDKIKLCSNVVFPLFVLIYTGSIFIYSLIPLYDLYHNIYLWSMQIHVYH